MTTSIPQAFQSLCPDCDVNYNTELDDFIDYGGHCYEDAIWLDTEINAQFTKPTKEQILAEIDRLNSKETKLKLLDNLYTAAQYIKVINGHSFLIPLKGDTFNILITNQVLAAQVAGSASLSFPDINGMMQTLIDVPFSEWQKFYIKAKKISFSNLILRDDKITEINNCQTSKELDEIDLNIFPAIDAVIIDI